MAVGYRSGSSGVNNDTSLTLTIPVPAGVVAGDLLVAITSQDSDGAIANLTAGNSGFTQLGTDGIEVGVSPAARCWYRVATGAEAGNFNFALDANSTGAGVIACLTGADTGNPLDGTITWASGTGTTENAPALTVAAGSMLICGFFEQGSAGHAHSQPAGMTEVADAASAWSALAMAVEARGAGATGTRSSTLTGALNGNWRTVSLAIAAAPGTIYEHASSPPVVRSPVDTMAATISTATFSPPAGCLAVAVLSFRRSSAGATATLRAYDSAGGDDWTVNAHGEWSSGDHHAQVAIFTKYFAAAPGMIAVSAGRSALAPTEGFGLASFGTSEFGGGVALSMSLAVRVVMNAATGQGGAGTYAGYLTGTANAGQHALTAAAAGSRVYVVTAADGNDTLTPTGATTSIDLWQNAGDDAVHAIGRSTALTAGAGSVGPYGWTGGQAGHDTAIALLEVLSAVGLVKTGAAAAGGAGSSPRATVALVKTGKAAASRVGSGTKALIRPLVIAPVNTLPTAEGTGLLAFTVTTTAVGNALIVAIRSTSATQQITSMAGGGCTWTRAAHYVSALRGRTYDIWIGQITAAVIGSTVTATWSGDVSLKTQTYNPQEFTNGSVPSTWALEGSQTAGVETSSTSTTIAWPSLTAAAIGELYVGQGSVNTGTPTGSGTPAGFTFKASATCWCYGKTLGPGVIAPTQTTSPAATFGGVAALIVATVAVKVFATTGGATMSGAGSGPAGWPRWIKTGAATAGGAGVVARAGSWPKTGGAVAGGAGVAARAGSWPKTGGATGRQTSSGARLVTFGPKFGGAAASAVSTVSKTGTKGIRSGGAAARGAAFGIVRITSDWYYAAVANPGATIWTTPELATGPTTGDYATWVAAGTAPGSTGTLELSGFPAHEPLIPSTAVPDLVTVKVRHAEGPIDQVATVTARAYVGSTPVGGSQPLTALPYPHEDQVTVTGLSYIDLVDLRVRIIVTRL